MNMRIKVIITIIGLFLIVGCTSKSKSNFADVIVKDDGSYYMETTNKSIDFEIKKVNNKVTYQVKDSAGNNVKVIEKDKKDYIIVTPQINEYEEFTIIVTEGVFKDNNIKNTKSITVSSVSSKSDNKVTKSDKEIVLEAINNTLKVDSYTGTDVASDFVFKIDNKNKTYYYRNGDVDFYCNNEKIYYMEDEKWKYLDAYTTKENDYEIRELYKYLLKASSFVKNNDNSYSVKTLQKDLKGIDIDISAHVIMKYAANADLDAKIKIENNYVSYFYADVTDLLYFGEDSGRENRILEYKYTNYNNSDVIIPEEAIKTAILACDPNIEPCY